MDMSAFERGKFTKITCSSGVMEYRSGVVRISPVLHDPNTPLSLRAEFMDGFDHCDHVFHRCFRQDAMAQIENMAGPSGRASEHVANAFTDFLRRCEQCHRV